MAKLKTEVTFIEKNGRTLSKRDSYHENGQLAETGVFSNSQSSWRWDVPSGPMLTYHSNGQLKSSLPYNEKGFLHGESLHYDRKGKLIKRSVHAHDKLVEEEIFGQDILD